MKAIYKNWGSVSVQEIQKPEIQNDDDVIIKVVLAGLCRTDIYVAKGIIEKASESLVIGHEFSGIVESKGRNVNNVSNGDRVCVMPVIPCMKCDTCKNGDKSNCPHSKMLGVERDGAFAEYIKVPASCVYAMPNDMPFMMGAYMEPIAASYAVSKTGIQKEQKGLICGDNRIGLLTLYALEVAGFNNLDLYDGNGELPENTYNFAIETLADDEKISEIVKTVKPNGKIVIKSRKYPPVGLVFNDIVRKELSLIGANYAPFDECIKLASNQAFKKVEELWGDVHPLEDFEKVFNSNENKKQFFSPVSADVWNR